MEVCSGVWRCVVGCGGGVEVCSGVWRCVVRCGVCACYNMYIRVYEIFCVLGM